MHRIVVPDVTSFVNQNPQVYRPIANLARFAEVKGQSEANDLTKLKSMEIKGILTAYSVKILSLNVLKITHICKL